MNCQKNEVLRLEEEESNDRGHAHHIASLLSLLSYNHLLSH